jgi:hypothetical protein
VWWALPPPLLLRRMDGARGGWAYDITAIIMAS